MPHITNAIQEWIERVAKIPVDGNEGPADVCIIELGGTIGMPHCLIFLIMRVEYCIYQPASWHFLWRILVCKMLPIVV